MLFAGRDPHLGDSEVVKRDTSLADSTKRDSLCSLPVAYLQRNLSCTKAN